MLLMPASCHLDRCYCKMYHNTKAINFTKKFLKFHSNYYNRIDLLQKTFDSLLDADTRLTSPESEN